MKYQTSQDFHDVTLLTASVFDLTAQVSKKFLLIEEVGDLIPGSVMVQNFEIMTNRYMNQRGCEILRHSSEELSRMGSEYFRKFFPDDEVRFLAGNFRQFIHERDYNKVYSFFQRVRPDESTDYKWYLTTSRLYPATGDTDLPEVMHVSVDVQNLQLAGRHIKNLCNDNTYQIKYYSRFLLLRGLPKT